MFDHGLKNILILCWAGVGYLLKSCQKLINHGLECREKFLPGALLV
jgi:hypothetical protein